MITRKEWIKAMKEMKEFCKEQNKCSGCEMEDLCGGGWNELNPYEWKIPEERSEK